MVSWLNESNENSYKFYDTSINHHWEKLLIFYVSHSDKYQMASGKAIAYLRACVSCHECKNGRKEKAYEIKQVEQSNEACGKAIKRSERSG